MATQPVGVALSTHSMGGPVWKELLRTTPDRTGCRVADLHPEMTHASPLPS